MEELTSEVFGFDVQIKAGEELTEVRRDGRGDGRQPKPNFWNPLPDWFETG